MRHFHPKDASGRVVKWAVELSPYVPQFARRDTIKSQALADFLVDWAEMQYKPPRPDPNFWVMHFDGSKVKEGLGAGVVLTSPAMSGHDQAGWGSFDLEELGPPEVQDLHVACDSGEAVDG